MRSAVPAVCAVAGPAAPVLLVTAEVASWDS
jgi:hypothetical protein